MSLENAKNEIYHKIGRNIMLFQKMEGYLKYITFHTKIAAYISELENKQDEVIKEVSNNTLGGLVSDHLGFNGKKSRKEPDVLREPFILFELELGESYLEEKKESLTSLVDERNRLVHHSYMEFDFKTIDSCKKISDELDGQEDRIQLEINDIERVVNNIKSLKIRFADFLKSDMNGLFFLQDTELVKLIADTYIKAPKIDDWVSLSLAGKLLLETDLEYKKKYNMNSLKKFIVGSDFFDIEERSIEQKSEMYFRIRPDIIYDEKSEALSYKPVFGTW